MILTLKALLISILSIIFYYNNIYYNYIYYNKFYHKLMFNIINNDRVS